MHPNTVVVQAVYAYTKGQGMDGWAQPQTEAWTPRGLLLLLLLLLLPQTPLPVPHALTLASLAPVEGFDAADVERSLPEEVAARVSAGAKP